VVVASLVNRAGGLVTIGRTVPLTSAQSAELAAVLSPAGSGHPTAGTRSRRARGGRDSKKPLTKGTPSVVVKVSADPATQAGPVRHAMRYRRVRLDLTPEDLAPLDA
jgi:hypothetical protein